MQSAPQTPPPPYLPVVDTRTMSELERLEAVEHLRGALDDIANAELTREGTQDSVWGGKPDRWYETPTWRCPNGHISKSYLKSEAAGGAVCLACFALVVLTFPEDKEAPPCE